MTVCETARLELRLINDDDAAFLLTLLNEPSFIDNIGDKGVRTLDDARRYIADGPLASYQRYGFGLWMVTLKDTREPMGMCGVLKREGLDDPDIGYALAPAFWSKGYAVEAATAVMRHARETLGLARVVAIARPGNEASIRVLEKIGLRFDRIIRLPGAEAESALYTPDT